MHDAEQDVPQRHNAVRDERTLLVAMRSLNEVVDPGPGRLNECVMDAWIACGRRGEPNTGDLPDWCAYRADERNTMVVGPNIRTITEDREAERAAWSTSILL